MKTSLRTESAAIGMPAWACMEHLINFKSLRRSYSSTLHSHPDSQPPWPKSSKQVLRLLLRTALCTLCFRSEPSTRSKNCDSTSSKTSISSRSTAHSLSLQYCYATCTWTWSPLSSTFRARYSCFIQSSSANKPPCSRRSSKSIWESTRLSSTACSTPDLSLKFQSFKLRWSNWST